MERTCEICKSAKPAVRRPRTLQAICKECFFTAIEEEVYHTIQSTALFKSGECIAIGASGGKDSTVLVHILSVLNDRYSMGLDLRLLSIDEGISGYRDDSLETVKKNSEEYKLPLTIVSYKDLYGWTMDQIVRKIGLTNNCTFCGVFRRQSLDKGARLIGATKIVTGHNADDIAETVLMNLLRGDHFRLGKCTEISTGDEGDMPRSKPFKYIYEKEIVLYAHFKKLVYFSTECIYSPNAYRGFARELLKDLERVNPRVIWDIIQSGEQLKVEAQPPMRKVCTKCGGIASHDLCKACKLLEMLGPAPA
jgi:cytoplasmic tRNA 2-thiolation protein 1